MKITKEQHNNLEFESLLDDKPCTSVWGQTLYYQDSEGNLCSLIERGRPPKLETSPKLLKLAKKEGKSSLANRLGIHRSTLYRHLKQLKMLQK